MNHKQFDTFNVLSHAIHCVKPKLKISLFSDLKYLGFDELDFINLEILLERFYNKTIKFKSTTIWEMIEEIEQKPEKMYI